MKKAPQIICNKCLVRAGDDCQCTDWYFTFGFAHKNAQKFLVIRGTRESARSEMFSRYGRTWAMQYDTQGWFVRGVSQQEKYGLKEIK